MVAVLGVNNLTPFVIGGRVLDALSGGSTALPPAAYSLRLLTASARNKAVNARRSSDNTSADIGFLSGKLNVAALLAFVGSGTGFVTKWYNQGSLGSAADAVQSTATLQPQIVTSGALQTLNGMPCLYFGSAQTAYLLVSTFSGPTGAQANFVNSVFYTVNTTANGRVCGFGNTTAGGYREIGPYVSGEAIANTGNSNVSASAGSISASAGVVLTGEFTTNVALRLNGTSKASATSVSMSTGSGTLVIGNGTAINRGLYGGCSELIVSATQITSDEQIIERSQESYYAITGV